MGKTTLSAMLTGLGIPVHDSDTAVHQALNAGEKGYNAVDATFPYFEFPKIYGKKNKKGIREINRKALRDLVFNNKELRIKLENILHPIVRDGQKKFIKEHQSKGLKQVGLDIPLLYETGGEILCDFVILATSSPHTQRKRVLARGMGEEIFTKILVSQMSDFEKRQRADYIVHTNLGRAHSFRRLKEILSLENSAEKNDNETELLEAAW